MQTRHVNSLMEVLEDVRDVGFSEIRKSALRAWYSRERITKPVWRDIQEKWEEVSDDPLFIGELEGSYALIIGAGLEASANAWYQPLIRWAEIEPIKRNIL